MSRLTKRRIEKAIDGSAGIIQVVANKCGVSRTWMSLTLHKPVNAKLLAALREERDKLIDLAESKLINEIKIGNFPAIKWFLTTQGKDRGYGDKIEITGKQQVLLGPLNESEKEDLLQDLKKIK